MTELRPNALGISSAVIGALSMFVLGILGNLGLYTGAVEMMQTWHVFFSLSVTGILAGIVEAAVICYALGWTLAYVYNKV
ncbi:MAG: hypothetical protein GOU98_01400 [Candidatus Altiarchaeota archaeon]|nr:hypothetical protein [Candidatus Altiarchaeota archaeon]